MKESAYLRRESKVYSNETTTETEAGDDPWRKHELGLAVGLGAKLKRISFEARYEKGNGISDYVPSHTGKTYFLLGYRF